MHFEIKEITAEEPGDYFSFFQRGVTEDEDNFRISPNDTLGGPFPTDGTADDFTLGAFVAGKLAGIVSFAREGKIREKLRHKGLLFRMLVGKEYRGMGVGQGLIREVLERARHLGDIEQVNLTVIDSNPTAKRLYERAGFTVFSHERKAVKWKDQYFDELTLVKFLR